MANDPLPCDTCSDPDPGDPNRWMKIDGTRQCARCAGVSTIKALPGGGPNAGLIERLETVLAEARAGDITGAYIVLFAPGKDPRIVYDRPMERPTLELIGALEIMKAGLIEDEIVTTYKAGG